LSEIRDSRAGELVAANLAALLSLPAWVVGVDIPVSVSVGVGTALPREMDFKVLLRRADAALYCAKDHNRHCFQVFSAGLEESPRENEQRRNGTEALAPKA